MHYRETRKNVKKVVTASLIGVFIFMLAACASNMANKQDGENVADSSTESPPKMITDISISDAPDATTVSIDGNMLLTYTSVKQPLPLGLVLYFPETSLGIAKTEYSIDSSVLGTIKAVELIESGPSKVTISLKEDVTYNIERSGNGLSVTFSNLAEPSETISEETETADSGDTGMETMLAEGDMTTEPPAEPMDAAIEEAPVPMAGAAAQASTGDAAVFMVPEIDTEPLEDSLNVMIRTGSTVNDFKPFTLNDPPRIVFDLNGVKGSYDKLQTLPVDTKWVKSIRHFTYPDKVRVVLDTEQEYLESFSAVPNNNGLLVNVGAAVLDAETEDVENVPAEEPEITVAQADISSPEPPAAGAMVAAAPVVVPAEAEASTVETDTEQPMEVDSPEEAEPMEPAAEEEGFAADEPADSDDAVEVLPADNENGDVVETVSTSEPLQQVVNRIDFLSHDKGKSTVVVETTSPVEYSLDTVSDTKLQLKLKDTKIFKYRQRPLITTRFESAVDRILPVQTPQMANDAMVIVELREAVPYTVEQIGSEINIHFEASTVPPKQLAKTNLPPWQQVMEESAETGATVPVPAVVASGVAASAPEVVEPEVSEPQMAAAEEAAEETEPEIEPEIQEDVEIEVSPEPESTDVGMEELEEEFRPRPKKYVGEKIALDFFETDIKNVLRILRDVSGKNFAVDDNVTGKVTLTLVRPVPWDQVLDLILKMNNLGKTYEGDVIRIVTLETLQLEEMQRAEALKAKQDRKKREQALEPLVTEYIPISYADATKDIKPRLDEIKTPDRGTVGVDLRNNQIIMTDIQGVISQAKAIVRKIDKVTPQVIIEARIVEVNDDYSRELGTEWGMNGVRDTTTDPGVSATSGWSVAMNNPPSNESGTIGYNFARISGSFALNAQLKAIETTDKGKIISSPKVVTLDNKEAIIKQGLEYPYLERDSAGLATVEFKDVDLELKVTPHVTPDNRISMKIDIEKNDVESLVDGVPALSTNAAHTELLVNDGDTIVIGGIMKGNFRDEEQGFPWLSKVPLVGWAFKTKIVAEETHELLIFITPRIVELEKNI